MIDNEKHNLLTSKNLTFFVLILLVLYFVTSGIIDSRFTDLENSTEVTIANQQTLLVAIAETTSRNGADSVTESIIKDCSVTERIEFNNLLGSLDKGLSRSELLELERLFGRCGSFSADRKAVMVSRLSRETEIYKEYVAYLSKIRNEDVAADYNVAGWEKLSEEEVKQSEFFTRLVLLQDQIISSLLDGNSATSDEIMLILQEVQDVRGSRLVANQQAAKIRAELTAI